VHDEDNRGRQLIKAPLLVIWSEGFSVAKAKPLQQWGEWAERVEGHAVPGGHFVCEEQPQMVLQSLLRFFLKHGAG
jgi:haloacetate dehalogenase